MDGLFHCALVVPHSHFFGICSSDSQTFGAQDVGDAVARSRIHEGESLNVTSDT